MKIYQCLKYLEVWSQLQIRGLDLQNSKILSKLSKLVKHIKFLLNTLLNIVNFALFKMNIRRELIYHAEFSRLYVIQNVYSIAEERTSLKYTSAICMCTYLLKIKRYVVVLSIKELYIYFKIKIKNTFCNSFHFI